MPTHFRPCIDLHNGKVKQIIGGTLDINEWTKQPSTGYDQGKHKSDKHKSFGQSTTICNFVSSKPASYFAAMFKQDNLTGGHVIMLGQGQDNVDAAADALFAYPKGLHIGGGLGLRNVEHWLDCGAEKVILTSFIFDEDLNLSENRLRRITELIGRSQLVIDLSCCPLSRLNDLQLDYNETEIFDAARLETRVANEKAWIVCFNGWKTRSNCLLNTEILRLVDTYASEILIHSINKEGLCLGMDEELVKYLGEQQDLKCRIVYAGGVNNIKCFETIERLSVNGLVDVTVGSALDLYGGTSVKYSDCVKWNRRYKLDV